MEITTHGAKIIAIREYPNFSKSSSPSVLELVDWINGEASDFSVSSDIFYLSLVVKVTGDLLAIIPR
jgi:hypothetical protein